MKYIDVDQEQHLVFGVTAIPEINDDECLVKVNAIGVNRADILQRAGKYPPPKGESLILGIEVCGEIIACGSQVVNRKPGELVCGLVAGGGYAEYAKVHSEHLIPLAKHYTNEQGAALAETYLTAYQCLFDIAKLKSRDNVLIHAGASGVGTAAIQLAKTVDARVVVTAGSEQKVAACLALGADQAINYKQTDFACWSKENQVSFDIILDVVAGEYVNKNINVAAMDARIVILSMLGGRYCQQIDVAKLLLKRINLHATTLRNRDTIYKSHLVSAFINQFGLAINDGLIAPVIDSVYSWTEAEQAHQKLQDNLNIGKIVLTVD